MELIKYLLVFIFLFCLPVSAQQATKTVIEHKEETKTTKVEQVEVGGTIKERITQEIEVRHKVTQIEEIELPKEFFGAELETK